MSHQKSIIEQYQLGYIPALETIEAAKKVNLSVCDYLEKQWNCIGATQEVINHMQKLFNQDIQINSVCEIGPGSGRYLEKIMQTYKPNSYEIYEIADDWAKWLVNNYNLISRYVDGERLLDTLADSIDLVQAHGVFVYLPFLFSISYFNEMARVLKSSGYAVFDILSDKCFDKKNLDAWLKSSNRYPSFLSVDYVKQIFVENEFTFIGDFFNPYGEGISHYLVFKKN